MQSRRQCRPEVAESRVRKLLDIVGDILRINPGSIVEGQSSDTSTVAGKGNLVLNKLIASGWLEEPERNDYQRQVFLDPNAEILLDAIRRIAHRTRHSLRDFCG